MSALFSKPKTPPPPKPIKLPAPVKPPAPVVTATETPAREQAFLRGRRRRGSGLSGLILTPLGGGGSSTMPGATSSTLGGGG